MSLDNNTDIELEEDDEVQDAESVSVRNVFMDFIVDGGQDLVRIDKFLQNRIGGSTRSKMQQAIEEECVFVNDKIVKSNYKVRPNDHIVVYSDYKPDKPEIIPQDIPLKIVYEDNDVLLINKPANMVVHPGHGNYTGTVINAVAFHFLQQNPDKELPTRIGMIHRIDKDTTGLLVLGKNEAAILNLTRQFKAHTVFRRYHALVWGDVEEDEGTIETYIGRHERHRKIFTTYSEDDEIGKHAITHYKVLERLNYVTLVECRLETGRTHQIRVHMKHIGHTLFNDAFYGGDKILKGTIYTKYKQFVENCFGILPRQALHAKSLGFVHPTTNEEIRFDSELPSDMTQVLEKWRRYVKAKGV